VLSSPRLGRAVTLTATHQTLKEIGMVTLQDIKRIVGDVLQLGDRANALTAESGLLGEIPEFDSMAVVSVLTALEEDLGINIEDDEVSAENFQTIGDLHALAVSKAG